MKPSARIEEMMQKQLEDRTKYGIANDKLDEILAYLRAFMQYLDEATQSHN